MAAPEVVGLAAPFLFASRSKGQEVCGHTCNCILLSKEAVVKAALYVICIFLVACPLEEVGSNSYHIINCAELLICLAEEMSLHIRRDPEFARILSAGAVHSTVGNCKLPETLSQVSPFFVACYLIKVCSAVDKGNACICVAVGK